MFSREEIALIVLILDIRHKPTDNDRVMYDYIKSTNKPYLLIANKADKIANSKVGAHILDIRKELNLSDDEILLPFSSEKKIYTEDIWKHIDFC